MFRIVRIAALDIADYLRNIGAKLHRSKVKEELTGSIANDFESQARFSEAVALESLEWYRSRLRDAPYWAKGHLRIAEIAFSLNDIAAAYAAVQAVLKLTDRGPLNFNAAYLLGKLYLRSHSFQQACDLLFKLHRKLPERSDIAEDLAAAYLGLSQFSEAYRLLSEIGEERLTREGHAAWQYLKQKMT